MRNTTPSRYLAWHCLFDGQDSSSCTFDLPALDDFGLWTWRMDTFNRITSSGVLKSPIYIYGFSLGAAALGYLAVKGFKKTSTRTTHAYPPGPPTRPLIGSMGSFPKDHLYQHFNEWAEVYGMLIISLYGICCGQNNAVANHFSHCFLRWNCLRASSRLKSFGNQHPRCSSRTTFEAS